MAHLTRSLRDQIEVLHRAPHSQQEIARIVGCHQSTISRELARSSPGKRRRYAARSAQRRAEERRKRSYDDRPLWQDNARLRSRVERDLRNKRSPDQIAGRLRQQKRKHLVSHQSIYRYVERDKERPGDWESDLVVSPRDASGAVATFAERTCLYFRAILVADKSADEMVRATSDALGAFPTEMRRTMTHDNGREIAKHEQITENLHMAVYCARPYRSCDRGLNEWYNRELRRFFPKGTDFSTVTQADVDAAVEWLNNCPRRSLNYRTPKEVFSEKVMRFTR